jgi:hypothetical protein
MVRNPEKLEQFELEQLRKTPVDYQRNLRIVQALYEEAQHLGTFRRKDPMEGLEHIIALAKAVNLV